MLTRRVLAAADRYSVIRLIPSVPGAAVGVTEPLKPAPRADVRGDVLVGTLQRRRWREFSVERVCADLLATLDAWQTQRASFGSTVRRTLDDR